MSASFSLGGAPAPRGNFMGGMKSFAEAGGFVTGLNIGQVGRIWYINTNTDRTALRGSRGGSGPNGRSPSTAFLTFAELSPFLHDNDVVVVNGVLREQVVAPAVFNITVIGGNDFTPRQATSSGTATGGGASWLPPASGATATTPLIEVVRAGWTFVNMQFSPHTASACVRLTRSAVTDIIDASHARFVNCYFSGGGTTPIGIEDNGGCGFVQVNGCRFQNLTSGIKGLNTAAAVPISWMIEDCRFQQNTNDITMSLSYAIIQRNRFMTAGSGATNKVISTTFVAVQGGNNHILLNQFTNTEAQLAPASGYTGAASDTWMNYVNDQAALAFGQPA